MKRAKLGGVPLTPPAPLFIAAVGLLGLLGQPRAMWLVIACFTLWGIAQTYLPVFWAIPTEALSQSTAAAAVGFINAVGSIAGFAGPYAFGYLRTRTGSFASGLALILLCTILGGLMLVFAPRKVEQRG